MGQYYLCERLLSSMVKSYSLCTVRALSNSSSARSALRQFTASTATISSASQQQHYNSNKLQLATLTPMMQSVRHNSKPNTRRPKVPHKERAIVLALTNEIYKHPLEGLPPTETCINSVKNMTVNKYTENPFEIILAREFLEKVEAAEIVVVVHEHSCSAQDMFEMRVQFHRQNMTYLEYYNNKIVNYAFRGTKYENLLHIYHNCCATVLCYDKDISKLLRLERKLPYITVMAAVMEGRLLSVSQLAEVARLPALPQLRATLLQTLTGQQQQLQRHLQHHQSELSGSLARHSDGPDGPAAEVATTE